MKIYYTWSEAIRAGSAIRPVQAFGKFYDAETGGTCANGAALEAIFGRVFDNQALLDCWDEICQVMRENYKDSLAHYIELPCKCESLTNGPSNTNDPEDGRIHRLDNIVVHLNNHHQWSRERIADWLESEEEKLGFVTLVEPEAVEVAQGVLRQ